MHDLFSIIVECIIILDKIIIYHSLYVFKHKLVCYWFKIFLQRIGLLLFLWRNVVSQPFLEYSLPCHHLGLFCSFLFYRILFLQILDNSSRENSADFYQKLKCSDYFKYGKQAWKGYQKVWNNNIIIIWKKHYIVANSSVFLKSEFWSQGRSYVKLVQKLLSEQGHFVYKCRKIHTLLSYGENCLDGVFSNSCIGRQGP